MSYEVTWSIEANHAGGYLYRLAPADGPLTEEEFNKIPLEFVGQQGFRWGGGPAKGGSELFLYAHSSCSLAGYDRTSETEMRLVHSNGTYVSTGTVPKGSKWSLNPVPRYDHGAAQKAKCSDPKKCTGMTDGQNAVPDLEIVDRVMIPKGLKPGPCARQPLSFAAHIWQSR